MVIQHGTKPPHTMQIAWTSRLHDHNDNIHMVYDDCKEQNFNILVKIQKQKGCQNMSDFVFEDIQ